MKNKISVLLLGLFIIIAGIVFYFNNRKIYYINIPVYEDVVSITLKEQIRNVIISDETIIKDIFKEIKSNKLETTKKSDNEVPNISNNIRIDFNFENMVAATIYLYNEDGKYYLEQPYNGIYQIKQETYDNIKKIFDTEKQ